MKKIFPLLMVGVLVLFATASLSAVNTLHSKQRPLPRPDPLPDPNPRPDPIEPQPEIFNPSAGTVWVHGENGIVISWDNIDGSLIKIELFKGSTNLGELTETEWIDSTTSYTLESAIQDSWGIGRDYRIKITGYGTDEILSEPFQISEPIDVNILGSDNRWATGENNIEITWTGALGNSVQIMLTKDSDFVANLSSRIPNSGSYILTDAIASEWGTGDGYRIVIADDLGNNYSSSEFIIDDIWVYSPSDSTIWFQGRESSQIFWLGGGPAIQAKLYNGDELVEELTNGWSNNNNSIDLGYIVPANWEETSLYRICVLSLGTSGDIVEGWSDYFKVEMSNDLAAGADVLNGQISGTIDSQSDVDFIKFTAQQQTIYEFVIDCNPQIQIDLLAGDSTTVLTEIHGPIEEWNTELNGLFFLRIYSPSGSTGDYSISLSEKIPASNDVEYLQISGLYGIPASGIKDAISNGYSAQVSFMPIPYLEAGIEWFLLAPSEGINYYEGELGGQSFLGGYAGVRSPEVARTILRAGAGYAMRLNSEELLLKSEYSEYVGLFTDGLKWYGGLDYKLIDGGIGTLFARLQFTSLSGADGLLGSGLSFAF